MSTKEENANMRRLKNLCDRVPGFGKPAWFRENATAIRAALAPWDASAQGWRPISEAPRDGRWLPLAAAGSGGKSFIGKWSAYCGSWVDTEAQQRDPTHYQELPAPPEKQ